MPSKDVVLPHIWRAAHLDQTEPHTQDKCDGLLHAEGNHIPSIEGLGPRHLFLCPIRQWKDSCSNVYHRQDLIAIATGAEHSRTLYRVILTPLPSPNRNSLPTAAELRHRRTTTLCYAAQCDVRMKPIGSTLQDRIGRER